MICLKKKLRLLRHSGLALVGPLLALCLLANPGYKTARAADMLYVSLDNNTIVSYNVSLTSAAAVQNSASVFATSAQGLNVNHGLAFDTSGNLFVANSQTSSILKITPGGVSSVFATNRIFGPEALAFDSSGNLFISNTQNGTIVKADSAGTVSNFATLVGDARGLGFDSSGNLYASTFGSSKILKFTPGGSRSDFVASTNNSYGLTVDSSDNVYYSSYDLFTSPNNLIVKVTPGGSSSTFATGNSGPVGLVFDSAGNLYVANNGNGRINKFNSSGVFQFSWSTGDFPTYLAIKSTSVPEPSTYLLGGLATGVLALLARRQRKAQIG
ncbi:MAG: PEP-CTERM sorting domain-containing protein [bacterium]